MPKNIILLSDGTGNAASKIWRTNVWRTFESLDLDRSDQVAKYDDGVGSSSFKPIAILGGAFGYGLKRNVIDLYKFLCRNYEPEAKIFVFGFSRGAFTARVLVGLIANQGLVRCDDEVDLHRSARAAYRAYRKEKYPALFYIEWMRNIRDAFSRVRSKIRRREMYDKAANIEVKSIRFLGVWDTVAAYGLPVEEMTRGISQYLWPLEFPDRKLSSKVQRACHALALDDERTTFHPMLWTEEGERLCDKIEDERVSQVWFVGAHSNVGGGYPDDSLAKIPLVWMLNEAARCGLKFKEAPKSDPDAIRQAKSSRDKDGRLYDSRAGLGGYYRYGPRKISDLAHMRFSNKPGDRVDIAEPKIHESVVERLRAGCNDYSPAVLPSKYAVARHDGTIARNDDNPLEQSTNSAQRALSQEGVWNWIWVRRVVYFLTIGASLYLMLFPLIHQTVRPYEFTSPYRLISEFVRIVQNFTPIPRWWPDAFATNPGWFALGVATLAILITIGSRLASSIDRKMNQIWSGRTGGVEEHDNFIFRLRTDVVYRCFFRQMKNFVLPLFSAIAVMYVLGGIVSHTVFNIADAMGAYCTESKNPLVLSAGEQSPAIAFEPRTFCSPTGIVFVEGGRYTVSMKITSFWKDGDFGTSVHGFDVGELPNWFDRVRMTLYIPLRRVILRSWGLVIGRVGTAGTDEYFFDPPRPPDRPNVHEFAITFTSRRDGEFFFYVNDATVGLPYLSDYFYRNNTGAAEVTIRRLR